MVRIQNMRPLAFKLIPWEFFVKLIILSKMDKSNFIWKTCPRTLLDRHDQTGFFSSGPQRTNSNLQTGFRSIGCMVVEKSRFSDQDDLEKCALDLFWTATIKPRQIEHSVFLRTIEFTDWSQVNRMFGCGEIVIFLPRMMIWKSVPSNFFGPPQLNQRR